MSQAEPQSVDERRADLALISGRAAFLGFLVKRLGNRSDAEDVLQEFCIRVLARKDQLRETDRMDAWLYAVLRSALNDHYRKAGRSRRLDDAMSREMATTEVATESAEAMDTVCGCIKGLIAHLRPDDAALIRRIDIEEQDRGLVAAELNLKPGTLNVRLHRARVALRDVLLDHCGCCCEHGFEDCSCKPAGCEHPTASTSCAQQTGDAHKVSL